MRNITPPARRAAWLAAALLPLLAASAMAAAPSADILLPENKDENVVGQPRPIEIAPPAPGQNQAKKPVPRAQRILVTTRDGKKTYVYKCGDEFTDNPVCTAPISPSTMRPTAEELSRCKAFKTGNFIPWYCR